MVKPSDRLKPGITLNGALLDLNVTGGAAGMATADMNTPLITIPSLGPDNRIEEL
jgi:hypothetical protein